MSLLPSRLSARFGSLAQRLGLQPQTPRQIMETAGRLRLRFPALGNDITSINWYSGTLWQRLHELPHGALAGPVQEDKAEARAALIRTINRTFDQGVEIDIKRIRGVVSDDDDLDAFQSFDAYLASREKRSVRIISYNDFQKALARALPGGTQHVNAWQAGWRDDGFYVGGVKDVEALASAAVYARHRQLDVPLVSDLTCYTFSDAGLRNLAARYYVLAVASESWGNPELLSLLVESGMPYARLAPLGRTEAVEYLILPRENPEAAALGKGLLLAGASDLASHLRALALGDF
ncbi:DUF6685 family protein [Pseudomonas matsuisoli]|uniref:Uncharacterized protein n=1 Tax=Pseudomonas matsuisoli TaxID=1515666 RepID=A0A917PSD0_9PSED|nr:DUF6685 family protein [Pseudomonas matsuisoli]GGJ89879.1 hypothetical protein GCM10009304_14330 [Pseudomonas matsuisoli]